jgi:lysyl-tRNA synthetase class 2
MEKVFEINRNFRNEGLSTRHNPEFTMLEYYTAYADFEDQMDFIENLFKSISEIVLGSTILSLSGKEYDIGKPFRRVTLISSIATKLGLSESELKEKGKLETIANDLSIERCKDLSIGKLQLEIFERVVEDNLDEPTFITSYPADVSPLSRTSDKDPEFVDRFELFINGKEIANGFSELNDPDDQAKRFTRQVEQKSSGDEEAMEYDSDYIEALEYGLPPCAGVGIGIDRLVMLFTGAPSIRDVLLFPQLKLKD